MYADFMNNDEMYIDNSECNVSYQYYNEELKKRQDSFLDSYYLYLKKKSALNKNILERKVIELELIDPTFNFYIT